MAFGRGAWYTGGARKLDHAEFDEVNTMYIETDRMVVRDFTMDDLNDMHDILGDGETMKNCEPAYTMEKTADFLQRFCIEKRVLLLRCIKKQQK